MIDKIKMVNHGVFLVRFGSKEDREKACNINDVLFDKKAFIMKPWFLKILYEKSSFSTIPICVNLPKLDVMYWTERALKTIAGYLGKVLKVDNATLTKIRMMYARVLFDMNIFEGFHEELVYSNKHDELIAQVQNV